MEDPADKFSSTTTVEIFQLDFNHNIRLANNLIEINLAREELIKSEFFFLKKVQPFVGFKL